MIEEEGSKRFRSLKYFMPYWMVYGMINGMKLHIDKSGRVVLPKAIRHRLGLSAGAALEATESPDGLLIRRALQRPSLVQTDGLLVHTGKAPRGFEWAQLTEELEQERIRDLAGL